MVSPSELPHLVARIEDQFLSINRIASTRPDDWRKRYVHARADLQQSLVALAPVISPDGSDLRDCLSRLQLCVTLHQAEWPVVAIDLDDTDYRKSMQGIEEAFHRFIRAARSLARHLER